MANRDFIDLDPQARAQFDAALARATDQVTPITEWQRARREPMDVTVCITLDSAEQEALERRLDSLYRLSPGRPRTVTPEMVSLWIYDAVQRVLDELKAAELSESERCDD